MNPDAGRVDAEAVLRELRHSRKYADLCDDALHRTALWAAQGSASARDAVKMAKRKLHQVYGAYVTGWKPGSSPLVWPPSAGTCEQAGRREEPGGPQEPRGPEVCPWPPKRLPGFRAACVKAMSRHASTRERLPVLDRFYEKVFAVSGMPRTVLDLGCGLHPLGLPWMGLPESSWYDAVDIDTRSLGAVREFFAAVGQRGIVAAIDLLSGGDPLLPGSTGSPPEDRYDLAFVLKTLPCLEQQEPAAGERLLERVRARWVVISFALSTIGGGRRQAAAHYDRAAARLLKAVGWRGTRLKIGDELVYVAATGV